MGTTLKFTTFNNINLPSKSITSSEFASREYAITTLAIDKIEYRLVIKCSLAVLVKILDHNKITYSNFYGDNNTIGIKANNIIFLHSRSNPTIYRIISNPTDFTYFSNYVECFHKTVPGFIRNTLTIARIDICFDIFNKDHKWVYKRLHFKGRQVLERVQKSSRKGETLYYGSPPQQLKLYDKKKQLKAKKRSSLKNREKALSNKFEKWTRVEISLTKKAKLPTQKINQLCKSLISTTFNPFESVYLLNYSFRSNLSPKLIRTKDIIQAQIEMSGFQDTKKHYAKNRNFKRKFENVVKLSPPLCFGKYYHKAMLRYLREKPPNIQTSN